MLTAPFRGAKRAGAAAVVVLLQTFAVSAAFAQAPCAPCPAPTPLVCPPACPPPATYPAFPTAPLPGQTPIIPEQQAPAATQAPTIPQVAQAPDFGAEQARAAGGGETFAAASSAVGYIDPALPLTCFRLRADAAYDNNRPDRAEYFYPKCGCFKTAGIDPNAPGPPLPETSVDYQDIRSYIEYAPVPRFSAFVELPVRFLNPDNNANTSGFADMNAGFKYAMQYTPTQITTFQLRTYIPTGDPFKGLGTDHVSLEPALLFYRQITNRLSFEGELLDWIPVGGTNFQGNIVQYGGGLGYRVYNTPTARITPVAEFVGWTVLNGKEFLFPENVVKEAGGDTIINAKFGVRAGVGQLASTNLRNRAEIYVGYGRALTGTVWYKDIMRLEFRLNF